MTKPVGTSPSKNLSSGRSFVFLDQEGDKYSEILHDAVVGDMEDGCMGVGIYCYDVLRGLHAGDMLDGAGDPAGDVESR